MIVQGVFILYVGHKFRPRFPIVNALLICKHRGIFGVPRVRIPLRNPMHLQGYNWWRF